MEPYQYFIAPIMDDKAQVAIIALMALALLDVLFGVVNAMFVQHNFSSHEFRQPNKEAPWECARRLWPTAASS